MHNIMHIWCFGGIFKQHNGGHVLIPGRLILLLCHVPLSSYQIQWVCNRNSSWLVFLGREVDTRMQGFWSAACSPANHAQRRGTPLGKRAFISCWQGRMGLHPGPLCSLRFCIWSSLASSARNTKFLNTKSKIVIKRYQCFIITQGLFHWIAEIQSLETWDWPLIKSTLWVFEFEVSNMLY